MTNEEAIKMLNIISTFPPDDPRTEALDRAREVLWKEIPVKPIFKLEGSKHRKYFAYCPICESKEKLKEGQEYCTECGQRLDWSDGMPGQDDQNEVKIMLDELTK